MTARFTLHEVYPSDKVVTDSELKRLENYLDKIWSVLKIDVEFTRHFKERMRDERNKKHITLGELSKIFQNAYSKFGKPIANLPNGAEALLKDMKTNINIPFVMRYNPRSKLFELISKTIMRKQNFLTRDKNVFQVAK